MTDGYCLVFVLFCFVWFCFVLLLCFVFVFSLSQCAGIGALQMDSVPFHNELKEKLQRRRDLVIQQLSKIPNIKYTIPQGAFYALPEINYFYGFKTTQGKIIADR